MLKSELLDNPPFLILSTRFDVTQPVDVDVEMGRVRSKDINAMEVENSFMIVQPEI